MPRPVAQRDIADFRQAKALPCAALPETLLALTSELEDQRHLFTVGMSYNVRANFAVAALIPAGDPLLPSDRVAEELVNTRGRDRRFGINRPARATTRRRRANLSRLARPCRAKGLDRSVPDRRP